MNNLTALCLSDPACAHAVASQVCTSGYTFSEIAGFIFMAMIMVGLIAAIFAPHESRPAPPPPRYEVTASVFDEPEKVEQDGHKNGGGSVGGGNPVRGNSAQPPGYGGCDIKNGR